MMVCPCLLRVSQKCGQELPWFDANVEPPSSGTGVHSSSNLESQSPAFHTPPNYPFRDPASDLKDLQFTWVYP